MNEAYQRALLANDEAHQRTLFQETVKGDMTLERMKEIADESKMWLRLLATIHQPTDR